MLAQDSALSFKSSLDVLRDLSVTFGDASILDQHVVSPNPSDNGLSSCDPVQLQVSNSGENAAASGANSASGAPYFMCHRRGSSTDSGADSPVRTGGSDPRSASGSGRSPSGTTASALPSPNSGSSVDSSVSPVPTGAGATAHRDPSEGEHH